MACMFENLLFDREDSYIARNFYGLAGYDLIKRYESEARAYEKLRRETACNRVDEVFSQLND